MNAEFSATQIAIVRFCAKECGLQQSGEMSVAWMLDGWVAAAYAVSQEMKPDVAWVLRLGGLIEPTKNRGGYRQMGVRVGWSVKMDHGLIPAAMDSLLAGVDDLTPEEWYRQYEEVHPFRDGNGRTGQILYNWLRGSLDAPVWAPNFWGGDRRTGLVTASAGSPE